SGHIAEGPLGAIVGAGPVLGEVDDRPGEEGGAAGQDGRQLLHEPAGQVSEALRDADPGPGAAGGGGDVVDDFPQGGQLRPDDVERLVVGEAGGGGGQGEGGSQVG